MISLLKQELYKLWSKKLFLVYLAFLFVFNFFLMWSYSKPSVFAAKPEAYKQITKELKNKDIEEQYSFVADQYKQIEAIRKIDYTIKQHKSNSSKNIIQSDEQFKELFDEYKSVYQNKSYLKYTDNINSEYLFLKIIMDEISQVYSYEEFLNEVQIKSDNLSKVSIFNKENSFGSNNIKKTAKAFEKMEGTVIEYSPQQGIIVALEFYASDIILILIMMLIAFSIVREEKDSGLLSLIRSTERGRLHTAIAKMMTLIISLVIVVVFLYGTNLLYCHLTYGLGNLDRSIQSIPSLMRSTLKVNLIEYLILFIITKWSAASITGVWILFCITVSKNNVIGILTSVSMPIAHYFIRIIIPATHNLNVIKYANIISLLQTNEILGSYRNLHWFNNKPIEMNIVELIAGIVYFIIFSAIFLFSFAKMQNITPQKKAVKLLHNKTSIRPTTISRQEWYKLLVLNGGAILLVFIIGIQFYSILTSDNYIDADEMFYAHYMKPLTGRYDVDSYNFLIEEREKFEPIYLAQSRLSKKIISYEEYEMILNSNYTLNMEYKAFERVINKLRYVKHTPSAHLVYETGYEKLFNLKGGKDVLAGSIFSSVSIILLLSGFFTIEKTSGMKKVIYVTPLGRNHTFKTKYNIALIISIFIGILSIVPEICRVGYGYGFKGLFSPLKSMVQYTQMPTFITIISMIIFMIISRILACYLMSCIVLYISNISNSYIFSVMINCCIILFPLILYYMGISDFMYFSVHPLFDVAKILSENMGIMLVLVYWFSSLIGISFFKDISKEKYLTIV